MFYLQFLLSKFLFIILYNCCWKPLNRQRTDQILLKHILKKVCKSKRKYAKKYTCEESKFFNHQFAH